LLRKVFVSEREERIRNCRKMQNEELQDLYLSPNNLRVMEETEMGRACGLHGEEDKFVRDFGGDS
jgi:hypothetical protein